MATAPTHLPLPQTPASICSHPSRPLLALGLMDSGVIVVDPTSTSPTSRTITHPLATGCPAIAMSCHPTCATIYAASHTSLHVFHPERPTSLQVYKPNDDNEHPFSPTCLQPYDPNTLLLGDQQGAIHLFDVRVSTPVCALANTLDQADYISAIMPVSHFDTHAVLVASGDATLCAYDVRMSGTARISLQYATDGFQDDLLSLTVLPQSSRIVAGTLSGALNLYNLRLLDLSADPDVIAHVDRFHGHPDCVNALLPVHQHADVVVSASADGFVRVVDLSTKTLLGVMDYDDPATEPVDQQQQSPKNDALAHVRKKKRRRHEEENRWPIEDMVSVNGLSKPLFALVSHDENVRFCDGASLLDGPDDRDRGDGKTMGGEVPTQAQLGQNPGASEKKKKKKKKKKRNGHAQDEGVNATTTAFFDGL